MSLLPGFPQRATSGITDYMRRLLNYHQMDIEFTVWQMWKLCYSPREVYQMTRFRKQTKNQWARDDPAFVAFLMVFMFITALAYTLAFRVSVFDFFKLVAGAVFVDFLGFGLLVATIGWFISNRFLRTPEAVNTNQSVEWLYCFDIHCNGYFPVFLLLYVVQFFLVPVLTMAGFFSALLSNTLYAVALSYYHYVSFLGYSELRFLNQIVVFLYPIGLIALGYIVSLLVGFNSSVFVLGSIYFPS